MKKLLLLLLMTGVVLNSASACSVCACTAGSQYPGLLPQANINFIGIQYLYRDYTSLHHVGGNELTEESGKNILQTIQTTARYNIAKRIQVGAFLPIIVNSQTEHDISTTVSGIGDATIMGGYRVIAAKSCNKWQHNLFIGCGVKLPTGKYDAFAIKTGKLLPNMQPGSSTFDFVASSNYTIMYNKAGLNLENSYIHTTPTKTSYKFGNRFSTALSAFYIFSLSQIKLMPQIGSRLDLTGSDYDNYNERLKSDMKGGFVVYGTTSLQLYYKSIGVLIGYRKPIKQHYADGLVNNNYQLETGGYILF